MSKWDSIQDGSVIYAGIIQIDIADHGKITGSNDTMAAAKELFFKQIYWIVECREGKLLNWGGDGGSFIFRIDTSNVFNDLAFSAIHMLGNMPGINEEIGIRTDLSSKLNVRISCHATNVTYKSNPGLITAGGLNAFLKNERSIGVENIVVVTEPIFAQLSTRLRNRFIPYKLCQDLNCNTFTYGWPHRAAEVGLPRLLHHVSLPVRDLQRSTDFYKGLLCLDPLPQAPSALSRAAHFYERPYFRFGGKWFQLPDGGQLHLVENDLGTFRHSSEIDPRDCHFAFGVADIVAAQTRLTDMDVIYLPDPLQMGQRQIYFVDPHNYHVIEMYEHF